MKTGFVFDLDGTLVDSIPGIARGLNLALKALGYPEHSVDAIREMVGKGARELCLASLKGYFNGNVHLAGGHGAVPRHPGNAVVPGRRRPSSGRFIQQAPCGYGAAGAPYSA